MRIGQSCRAFIKAATIDDAKIYLYDKLHEDCTGIKVFKSFEHRILPSSVCINFQNPIREVIV